MPHDSIGFQAEYFGIPARTMAVTCLDNFPSEVMLSSKTTMTLPSKAEPAALDQNCCISCHDAGYAEPDNHLLGRKGKVNQMPEDQWWGYSRKHGWVVLDRTKPCNEPGQSIRLVFTRCNDWNEFYEERENWDLPEYTYAPNYIKKLSGDAVIQANELYNKLRNEWPIRKKRIQQEKLEKERLEREAIEKMRQRKIELKKFDIEERKRKIISKFEEYQILCLWHLTHKDNISSILRHGILNHDDAYRLNVNSVDISDHNVQIRRETIEPYCNRKIHEYAPLYLKPRNPMLYVLRHLQSDLCLVEVSLSALLDSEYLITDGNAACRDTQFFNTVNYLSSLPWDVLNSRFWKDHDDGKRKMCAEVLIYPKITPKYIDVIHCYSKSTLNTLANCGRIVKLSPNFFF